MATPELQIETITPGTGRSPKKGETVAVHYTGRFLDGKVFDSSVPRKEPLKFVLGAQQVIAGLDLGVAKLKIGDKAKLTIPRTSPTVSAAIRERSRRAPR